MKATEVSKEIKKSLISEFGKIEALSVKCSKCIIKINWYDVELEEIKLNVNETLKKLFAEHSTLYINGIELWKDYSLEFMKNNEWMKLKRSYNFKFQTK